VDDAAAALEQAEGELEEAHTRLRKTAIRAPFAGILGLKQVSLGAVVDPGDPIVRLTQTHPLDLVFSLAQRHVAEVGVGQRVRGVVGGCGERFDGEVTVVEPHVDPATRMVRLQARVPNGNGRLLPGMAARVKVEVATVPDALLVPQEAILRQGSKRLVYVVGEDGAVERSEVALGEYFADEVEITAGLAPGATVVAAGHQKLRPGARVKVEAYEPIENPNLELGSEGVTCEF
jgi:membrane fusion protein (multidrug efflux system)